MTSPQPETARLRRLGVLLPSVNTVLEQELSSVARGRVSVHFQRIPLRVGSDRDTLEEMTRQSPQAAELLAHAKPDALLFGCTSGSFIGGRAFEDVLTQRLREAVGAPVVLTADSVARALRNLSAVRVGLATPYLPWVTDAAANYLESHGFEVIARASLRLTDGHEMAALSVADVTALAERVAEDADAVVLSCTNLPTFGAVELIEERLGCPVVSSNSASWWAALTALDSEIEGGPGRLFGHAVTPRNRPAV